MKLMNSILTAFLIIGLLPSCGEQKKVPAPVAVKTDLSSERDQKISKLCKQFVDLDNKDINWNIFCDKIIDLVKDDQQYNEICTILDKYKTSTSATSTCLKLKPHLKKLPKVVYDEFETFSVSQLLKLISTRMKQEVVIKQTAQTEHQTIK